MQWIFASVLHCEGRCLGFAAHLQVAEVEFTLGNLKVRGSRRHAAHHKCVLDVVFVNDGDVAGEVAGLGRHEFHWQLAGRTC